jgi:hypothetical protein
VQSTGPDGLLENQHILLLMDDIAVFATTREKLITKLQKLKECADSICMTLHPTKSQYFAINCDDAIPIILDDVTIAKCDQSWSPYIKPTSYSAGQRSYQPEKTT